MVQVFSIYKKETFYCNKQITAKSKIFLRKFYNSSSNLLLEI